MVAKLCDVKVLFIKFINKPVLIIDATGKISGKAVFKRFRLTNAVSGIALCFSD